MPHTEPQVPSGMRLLPELPTLLDVYAGFGERECVRLSASFVQTLDIPEVQRDFLLWPGLPNCFATFTLNLNWNPEIHFCMEDKQLRFAELYQISVNNYQTVYMERFTGFLWTIEGEEPPRFFASGLEQFFLLETLILKLGSLYCATQNDQEEIVQFGDADDEMDSDFTLLLSLEPRIFECSYFQEDLLSF